MIEVDGGHHAEQAGVDVRRDPVLDLVAAER
jgi:very-short-patch-repair endonuclease